MDLFFKSLFFLSIVFYNTLFLEVILHMSQVIHRRKRRCCSLLGRIQILARSERDQAYRETRPQLLYP